MAAPGRVPRPTISEFASSTGKTILGTALSIWHQSLDPSPKFLILHEWYRQLSQQHDLCFQKAKEGLNVVARIGGIGRHKQEVEGDAPRDSPPF